MVNGTQQPFFVQWDPEKHAQGGKPMVVPKGQKADLNAAAGQPYYDVIMARIRPGNMPAPNCQYSEIRRSLPTVLSSLFREV
ncbi:Hypothetical predicted protein [Lecanosticta acicola]|uniref:Uncharacterized protein n=1 Tax=Lecanosticta acicola TaxID=111012 RepID=A0AAI9ECQ4_9PEZI|nr:Hypothetical predicted protein [Lecanosticta acicola]